MTPTTSAAEQRQHDLAALAAKTWDLVVIGGGISGAGVLREAARRGWTACLIEQQDFAWGTSSRSSKMVHGGLRYLKEGQVALTLHSVRERQRLMREAPELIEPQSFLFADCTGRKPGRWLFQLGLMVYDRMAAWRSHAYVNAGVARALAPGLAVPNLRGAMTYVDAKTDDARLVMRVLAEAQADGATALNYIAATSLLLTAGLKTMKVSGVRVQDALSQSQFEVQARVVVNATGVWADRLRAGVGGNPILRPLRGSHLVLPAWRLPVAQAVSLMHPKDGRPVFFYPWEGVTLVGTTDLDHADGLDDEAHITPAEVAYLLDCVNDQFPGAALTTADITACYAGVRPIVADGAADASKAAREHVVLNESGLVTLTGGKLTTFRLMALDALEIAAPGAGQSFSRGDSSVFLPSPALNPRWGARVCHRLAARYGAQVMERLAQLDRLPLVDADFEFVPGTQTLWLELKIATRDEQVVHLDDLLLRRTRLGILLPKGACGHLPKIRQLCQSDLMWDDAKWDAEVLRYRALIQKYYSVPPMV